MSNYKFYLHRFVSNYGENGKGFELKYESSGLSEWTHRFGVCGGSFTTPNGLLTSPSYPENYPDNADCIYTISGRNSTHVNMEILTLDIEYDSNDSIYDY